MRQQIEEGRTDKLTKRVGVWASTAVAAAALTLVPGTAQAELIATDHFLGGTPGDPLAGEYDLSTFKNQFRRGNANGGGQDPTVAGFVNPWSGNVTSGSLGVAQWTVEADSVESGFSYVDGGRARFSGVDNIQRRVQRELDTYTPSNTYFMSLTAQVLTNELDLDGFVGVGFTNTGATVTATDNSMISGSDLRGLLIGAAGDGVSGTDYVVRHVGSTGSLQDDILLNDIEQNDPLTGTPYLRHTVVRIDFNDDPSNPAGNSKLTVWQDPSVFDSEAQATADTAPLIFRTFALGTNADITHLTMTGIDYSRAASFDEPRFGTTWEEVLPDPIIEGDLNGDGFVGVDDLNIVLVNWNQNVTPGDKGAGDPTGEGFVGVDDLNIVLVNWNNGTPPPGGAAVPEPASLGLLTIGGLACLRRRR